MYFTIRIWHFAIEFQLKLIFISSGVYFKLFDLEISGYLDILEMIRNDICTGIEFIFLSTC